MNPIKKAATMSVMQFSFSFTVKSVERLFNSYKFYDMANTYIKYHAKHLEMFILLLHNLWSKMYKNCTHGLWMSCFENIFKARHP